MRFGSRTLAALSAEVTAANRTHADIDRLFQRFAVDISNEPYINRKANTLVRALEDSSAADPRSGEAAIADLITIVLRSRAEGDRKSTRLNSSHVAISYAVFCLKKKKKKIIAVNAERILSNDKFI